MGSNLYRVSFLTLFTSFFIQLNSEKHAALFVFGDSLFAPNTNDGHIIPDFIAQYAGLPLISHYQQPGDGDQFIEGSNFASGGSGALVETNRGDKVVLLKAQLQQFQNVTKLLKYKPGKAEATKIMSNAVYMFSVGHNDYAAYNPSSSTTKDNYISMVIGNITDVIKEIYKEGGRKFAFVSLFPIGCIPNKRLQTGECNPNLNKLARQHNKAFYKVIENLPKNLCGLMYSIFDLYNTAKQRIDHPSKYGFEGGMIPCCHLTCCNNPWAYVFHSVHPTERADEQFSQLAWNGTSHFVVPYNFRTLFKL